MIYTRENLMGKHVKSGSSIFEVFEHLDKKLLEIQRIHSENNSIIGEKFIISASQLIITLEKGIDKIIIRNIDEYNIY